MRKAQRLAMALGLLGAVGAWSAAAWAGEAQAQNLGAAGPGGGFFMSEAWAAEAPGEDGPPWLEKLNLTPEQMDKLKAERLTTRKQVIKLQADIEALHLDLFNESMKDQPDLAKVETLTKQISELQGQVLLARTRSVMYLHSLLTPEQRKIMEQMQAQYWGERKARRNRPHGQW